MRPLTIRRELIRREPLKHAILRPGFARKIEHQHENRRPLLRPQGSSVTIGIAVQSPFGHYIVLVSDQRQSFQNVYPSVDAGMTKVLLLSKCWGFLFAGAQAGYARAIRRKAVALLGDRKEDKTLEQVMDAVRAAYRQAEDEIIQHRYLAKYGFANTSDFLHNSRYQLGERATEQIAARIAKYEFGMELLIVGFEGTRAKFAEINEQDIVDHSDIDAWAIGSGHYLAMGSLNGRFRGERQPITNVIKAACTAKFCAEDADGVGKFTTVLVWYPDGWIGQMPNSAVSKLREEWLTAREQSVMDRSDSIIEGAFARDPKFSEEMKRWRNMAEMVNPL
jgi:hypothetical protein